jgi:hypothetical protein
MSINSKDGRTQDTLGVSGNLIADVAYPEVKGPGPGHPPAADGASGALGLINEIGKFKNVLEDNHKFQEDFEQSHGRIANALTNIPENTPGGVMVKFKYGYDATGQMQYYGVNLTPGLNATQAYESASQEVAQPGRGTSAASIYIWIPKHPNTDFDPVSSKIPPNVSVMSLREYDREFRISDAQTKNDRMALSAGNDAANRQYDGLRQQAVALNLPNAEDQAAVALQSIRQVPGFKTDQNIELMHGKNGGLIASQGEGATALNTPVPQARQGDFERVAAQLSQTPPAQTLTANPSDNPQQNETQRQSNPLRA